MQHNSVVHFPGGELYKITQWCIFQGELYKITQWCIFQGGELYKITQWCIFQGGELYKITQWCIFQAGELYKITQWCIFHAGELYKITQWCIFQAGELYKITQWCIFHAGELYKITQKLRAGKGERYAAMCSEFGPSLSHTRDHTITPSPRVESWELPCVRHTAHTTRSSSTAGRLITGSRSRLGGEYVEMTLFLNGNRELHPGRGARPVTSAG